jgi:hypothetical protein
LRAGSIAAVLGEGTGARDGVVCFEEGEGNTQGGSTARRDNEALQARRGVDAAMLRSFPHKANSNCALLCCRSGRTKSVSFDST